MSITGGLFNAKTNRDDAGDTRTTADGDATVTEAAPVDLTTSLPGFDDTVEDEDTESFLIEGDQGADAGNLDVEGLGRGSDVTTDVEGVGAGVGVDDLDVDAPVDTPLDPES